MSDKIYIIGHKSPDLDSAAAAIAYANLKNQLENTDKYIAAAAGPLNRETEYALKKFGLAAPEIIGSVKDKDVILVDHNEFAQAADGITEARILEILDHHKLDFKYAEPIAVNIMPWGASNAIIAQKYFDKNVAIEKNLAGLMLAAILVDTVITKSPTCTDYDKDIIARLAAIADIADYQAFGMEIFKVRSNVMDLSDREIIKSDFKDFDMAAGKFGIGQIETVDLGEFKDREDALLKELDGLRAEGSYHTAILFITDIIKEGSQFLVSSIEPEKIEKALDTKLENGRAYLDGIISRKKQVAPKFSEAFDQ